MERDKLTENIKSKAEHQAEITRREIGDIVIDATDEYFPKAVRQRRRRDYAAGVVLGTALGFAIGYGLTRR